ncbi:MAG: transcription antitermination factor NusB [Planctomycetota bacterium]
MVAPDAPVPSPSSRDAVGPARWRALTASVALERGRVTRLRDALRLDGLSARDRALALELTLGVERRRVTLDVVLSALAARGTLPPDPYARCALRLGAYQVLYLPRIAPHAAVATAVALLRKQRSFVNAMLRRLARLVVDRAADPACARSELPLPGTDHVARALVLPADSLPDPGSQPAQFLGALHGLPTEMVTRWLTHHGLERTRALVAASAATPGVTLRVCPVQTNAEVLGQVLAAEGVRVVPLSDPRLLQLAAIEGESPFTTRAYRDGLFSVQDPTALAAADAVAVLPGETVLDLCAAPGGKASALAEALAGRGAVYAHDADPSRLAQVRETCTRLHLEATLHVVDELANAPEWCDAVLVDVPCSNTGVLARRVEVRRRALAPALPTLVREQAALLRSAIARTRPGGRVVYSTCSLEPEENRGVVDAVVGATGGVTVEREQVTWPEAGQHDGGYFAVLRVGGDDGSRP